MGCSFSRNQRISVWITLKSCWFSILSSAGARGSINTFFCQQSMFPLTPGVKGHLVSSRFYFCKRLTPTSGLRFGNPTLLLLLMESPGTFYLEPNPGCCLHFVILISMTSFLDFLPQEVCPIASFEILHFNCFTFLAWDRIKKWEHCLSILISIFFTIFLTS